MYAVIGRVKIKPDHEEETRSSRTHAPGLLRADPRPNMGLQDCLSARWPSASFRPSAGPCRLEFRAGPTVSRLLRLTPRGARSAVGGIRLCVSGIVKAQRQPLSDTTYIARGWVPISTSMRPQSS